MGKWSNSTIIFFKWLVQPPTRHLFQQLHPCRWYSSNTKPSPSAPRPHRILNIASYTGGDGSGGGGGGDDMSWWAFRPGSNQETWASWRGGWRKKRGGRNREWYEATMFKDHGPLHSWYAADKDRPVLSNDLSLPSDRSVAMAVAAWIPAFLSQPHCRQTVCLQGHVSHYSILLLTGSGWEQEHLATLWKEKDPPQVMLLMSIATWLTHWIEGLGIPEPWWIRILNLPMVLGRNHAQNASGNSRFGLGSPTKHVIIMVVT